MVNLYKVFPIAYSFALTLMISLWIRTKVTVKNTPFSYISSSFILPVSPNVATDEEMRLLEEKTHFQLLMHKANTQQMQ